MIIPTGMNAVQKMEKNMSRHLNMSVDALDRERRCHRSNLELAAADWRRPAGQPANAGEASSVAAAIAMIRTLPSMPPSHRERIFRYAAGTGPAA